jgi:hypothetical protein
MDKLTQLKRCEGTWIRLDGVPCALSCCYCINGHNKRQGIRSASAPASRASRRREVLRDVESVLAAAPPDRRIDIHADDILEYEGILDILAVYRRRGRRCDMITPGLRLADEAFAKAVSRFDVCFTITYLAHTPSIYRAMVVNPKAQALVQKAISNMRRLNIPFHVNCVLTSHNVSDLPRVAGYILEEEAQTHITFLNFYLERCLLDKDPSAYRLFAPLPRLRESLREVRGLLLRLGKNAALVDLPPCQLGAEIRACPRFRFEFAHPLDFKADSPTPMFVPPACADCVLARRCSRVSIHYKRHVQPGLRFVPLTAAGPAGPEATPGQRRA